MKIKVGDLVQIVAGKDKGKQGKVIQCFPQMEKVVVENANTLVKHLRPQVRGEKGQRVEFSAPIHVSNVKLICPHTKEASRVGFKRLDDGSKKRYSKKSGEIID